jgi:MFS family permease
MPTPSPLGLGARHGMYGMMVLSQVLNWFMRVGVPQLLPFLVSELRLSEIGRGAVLGAFFPSYVAVQVPAGMLERYTGAKPLIVANLFGVGGCLLAMPSAARRGGVVMLTALQMLMGAFAGLLFPVQKMLLREWAPLSLGGERVWALRASALGMQVGIVGGTWLTPRLATSGPGAWGAVLWLYGAMACAGGVLWQALATSTPREWRGISHDELQLLESGGCYSTAAHNCAPSRTDGQISHPMEMPLDYLVRPSVLATFWINVADNATMYTLQQWAALFFMERHQTSAAQAVRDGGASVRHDAAASGTLRDCRVWHLKGLPLDWMQ